VVGVKIHEPHITAHMHVVKANPAGVGPQRQVTP
jgi:hypothetical protein